MMIAMAVGVVRRTVGKARFGVHFNAPRPHRIGPYNAQSCGMDEALGFPVAAKRRFPQGHRGR